MSYYPKNDEQVVVEIRENVRAIGTLIRVNPVVKMAQVRLQNGDMIHTSLHKVRPVNKMKERPVLQLIIPTPPIYSYIQEKPSLLQKLRRFVGLVPLSVPKSTLKGD